MTRLYDLGTEYEELERLIDEGEDVSTELALIEGAIEDKAAKIAHVLANLDADIDGFDAELKRLAARKAAAVANKERLRTYVRGCMEKAGVRRIMSRAFSVSLQNGNEHVVIVDEKLIPEAYWRVKKEVSKSGILDAYKTTGECVPGTRIERGTKLIIR